ncbi:MAG TPA: protein kinase [Archangium sp.]|uniref:serine/threonine protein kinase n=1 Tax=Archangium sp. TaxID=1872627 RepID=UPI002ED90A3E
MKPALEEVVPAGLVVAGYRIERKLGGGGQGKVYLAWREGRPYALKFIHLERVGEWGWRELYILLRHQWPNVVRLLSHFRWPEEGPEYLVLVMEWVRGRTVRTWAAEDNPSAREAAELVLKLARALGHVHEQGVLHRDLKDDNVLVREADREPVLVDFGAGSLPGAPRVTRGALAPADLRFRSPESVAFFLRPSRQPDESYPYTPADDLYALGVILYALLTDTYPIEDAEPLMLAEILSCQPLPPHEMNERVPRALSAVCMRLLEKKPEERLASTGALCAALEAALKDARGEAAWDVPLCLGWEEEDGALEVAKPGPQPRPSWMDRWVRHQPRRGKRPTEVKPPAPMLEPVPTSGPALTSASLRRADALAALWKAAAVLAVLVLAGLGAELLARRGGGEMARGDKPPEAERAAAPPLADTTPAVVAPPATPPKDDAPVKTQQKTPSPDKRPKKGTAVRNACAGLVGAALQACVGTQQQPAAPVRSAPPALECPPGSVETMTDTLDIRISNDVWVMFPHVGDAKPVDVRQLATVRTGRKFGKLEGGTVLSGRLFFTTDRVYGLFTEAKTHDGATYPVCLELVGRTADWNERGVERKDVGGPADAAVVFSTQAVRAVEQFK